MDAPFGCASERVAPRLVPGQLLRRVVRVGTGSPSIVVLLRSTTYYTERHDSLSLCLLHECLHECYHVCSHRLKSLRGPQYTRRASAKMRVRGYSRCVACQLSVNANRLPSV